MLIDKKILGGGIALLVVGFALTATFSSVSPVGREGMTDDEIAAFLIEEQENQDYTTCLLYTSPSPRDATLSRMPSSA